MCRSSGASLVGAGGWEAPLGVGVLTWKGGSFITPSAVSWYACNAAPHLRLVGAGTGTVYMTGGGILRLSSGLLISQHHQSVLKCLVLKLGPDRLPSSPPVRPQTL